MCRLALRRLKRVPWSVALALLAASFASFFLMNADRWIAVYVLRPVAFAPGSAVFESGSREALDRLGGILRRCDSGRIEIGGHTDSQGSTALNQRLSRARAEAVLDALMARGVALDRLAARGYGEEQPVASNETEAGRALNRRIEFTALD